MLREPGNEYTKSMVYSYILLTVYSIIFHPKRLQKISWNRKFSLHSSGTGKFSDISRIIGFMDHKSSGFSDNRSALFIFRDLKIYEGRALGRRAEVKVTFFQAAHAQFYIAGQVCCPIENVRNIQFFYICISYHHPKRGLKVNSQWVGMITVKAHWFTIWCEGISFQLLQ